MFTNNVLAMCLYDEMADRFDLSRCLDWIDRIQARYVCVYFHQKFHPLASKIVLKLQECKPSVKFVVVVSCNSAPKTIAFRGQDFQTSPDAVVYFGQPQECLYHRDDQLPTMLMSLVPGPDEIGFIKECLEKEIPNKSLLFISDLSHIQFLDAQIISSVTTTGYELGYLEKPEKTEWSFEPTEKTDHHKINEYHYWLKRHISEYEWVVYIGQCRHLELLTNCQNILVINPYEKAYQTLNGSKEIRKRISLMEKFKTQSGEAIGIVMLDIRGGDLTPKQLMTDTRKLCKRIKKQPYFLQMSQTDYECRLGNFTQLTGFVFVNSCSCCDYDTASSSSLSKYLYPVILWNEFRVVCREKIKYAGIEWNQDNEDEEEEDEKQKDLSSNDDHQKQLIDRSVFQKPESWYGLVVDAGSHRPGDIKEGRRGIASGYINEQDLF